MLNQESDDAPDFKCGLCEGDAIAKIVGVSMWSGGRLVVIEDVPVRICERCEEQYYDEATSDLILQLASEGFPAEKVVREMTVPVFNLPAPKPGAGRHADAPIPHSDWSDRPA